MLCVLITFSARPGCVPQMKQGLASAMDRLPVAEDSRAFLSTEIGEVNAITAVLACEDVEGDLPSLESWVASIRVEAQASWLRHAGTELMSTSRDVAALRALVAPLVSAVLRQEFDALSGQVSPGQIEFLPLTGRGGRRTVLVPLASPDEAVRIALAQTRASAEPVTSSLHVPLGAML